ncbi:T3SS effector HopA1 family protein [Actinoplanes oblitus]|uniref:T3SS effector HopA1 family protein n=1 Tax=Actinoplanes oblitus TaxID=3040509 RepID=A0ABY8WHV8_9ACTN|nr:T3SS effector HopA1 family protein [Actinoplanes oblitus]WIM96425.1 T3SS effector HopA1 family protein [Actinoplanes oblitus]
MNHYRETYRRIASEVEIVDQDAFRHQTLGTLRPTREIDVEAGHPVVAHLWRFIYLHYYVADEDAALTLLGGSRISAGIAERENGPFVDRVAAARSGRRYADPGWRISGEAGSEWKATRDGLTLTVRRDEISGLDRVPQVGDEIAVLFPAERRYTNPGWYVAIGRAGLRREPAEPVVRFYFALDTADEAPGFLASIENVLNGANVPFHMKVVNDPAKMVRNDAVVLYMAAADGEIHYAALASVYARYRHAMRAAWPCFARRLEPGWGMAAEPTEATRQGLSYGQHRCVLVAEGLLRAWTAGTTTAEGRERAIIDRLAAAGVDPDAPYRDRPLVVIA